MNKKKNHTLLVILLLLIVVVSVTVYIVYEKTPSASAEENNINEENTTTTEAKSEIMTILDAISNSSYIESGLEENIELHATNYFEEIYFEVNDYVEEGQNILKYTDGTYLTAPYNCVITELSIPSLGEECTNNHYVNVASTDLLQMQLSVDETQLSEVSLGQEAQIDVSVYDDKPYTGYVTNISNTGTYSSSSGSSSFTVTVQFPNDGEVLIGMSAKCSVILNKAEDVVAVPSEAITTENREKYVTVIDDDGKTEKVQVETGISNDAYTEIKSGLDAGETVQITKSTTTNSFNKFGSFGGDKNSEGKMPDGVMPKGVMPSGEGQGGAPQGTQMQGANVRN